MSSSKAEYEKTEAGKGGAEAKELAANADADPLEDTLATGDEFSGTVKMTAAGGCCLKLARFKAQA